MVSAVLTWSRRPSPRQSDDTVKSTSADVEFFLLWLFLVLWASSEISGRFFTFFLGSSKISQKSVANVWPKGSSNFAVRAGAGVHQDSPGTTQTRGISRAGS